jgi:S1-C subfamily serine protease
MVKGAVLVTALMGAAAAGAAMPPAYGQSAPRARALEVLRGGGGQIGISVRDVEPADDKTGGAGGVIVEEVSEDSPASTAGLRQGDIVVEYDGERVRSVRQFTRLVHETVPGRKVQAALLRDGQRTTVTLEPRETNGFQWFGDFDGVRVFGDQGRAFHIAPPALPPMPAPPALPATPVIPDLEAFVWRGSSGLGITTSELSPQLAEYFGTKDGVLVTTVTAESAAAKAGLKAGDVVTSLNGTSVESAAALRRHIQRLRAGDAFTIGVMRDRKALTLTGKMDERQDRRRTFRTVL